MSRCRFILLIIVLAVLVTMVSFGAFQNQSPLNSGRYFTRNGGFVSEDAETEMIPIEDGLVYSVAIGVSKGMDNEKMATQKLFHKGILSVLCTHYNALLGRYMTYLLWSPYKQVTLYNTARLIMCMFGLC